MRLATLRSDFEHPLEDSMGDTITIEFDVGFLEWWKTTIWSNDQGYMLIAWESWKACKERLV